MTNLIGKYAKIKNEVKLSVHDQLTQIHNHTYRICNQKENGKWICLETKVYSCLSSVGGNKYDVVDRSFWMKTEECEIVDKPCLSYYSKQKNDIRKVIIATLICVGITVLILFLKK